MSVLTAQLQQSHIIVGMITVCACVLL